jgi:hypothetical protein
MKPQKFGGDVGVPFFKISAGWGWVVIATPRSLLEKKNLKATPLEAWTGSEGSKSLRLPDFKTFGTWRW